MAPTGHARPWRTTTTVTAPAGGLVDLARDVYDQVMDIIGIGLDATEIPRVAATMARYGDRFLRRVFTEAEVAYCQAHRHAAQHFAARFAVKEAAMKALGTGHSLGVLWRDVEVVRHGGPPQLQLHGAANRRFATLGGRSSVVTITHTDTLAMAQVILLR
ncbi:MAG TPA: holo-ACP synthase [Vicinamibacterales bacterium]|jgi:holo-[acyl-carrier protein] synthase